MTEELYDAIWRSTLLYKQNNPGADTVEIFSAISEKIKIEEKTEEIREAFECIANATKNGGGLI